MWAIGIGCQIYFWCISSGAKYLLFKALCYVYTICFNWEKCFVMQYEGKIRINVNVILIIDTFSPPLVIPSYIISALTIVI